MSVATTEPASRTAFHLLTVAAVEQLTDDAVAVTFDVPDELRALFDFAAGQSLTLRRTIDGVEHRRTYSICAPVGSRPRIGVREIPGGLFSSWLVHQVRPGDRIEVQAPSGSFRADPDAGWPPPLHRRRFRHHADAVRRGVGAGQPRGARDASLRQPHDDVGDVRRGARRPQGRAPPALRPDPRALARTARRRAVLRAPRRRAAARAAHAPGARRRHGPRVAVRTVRHARPTRALSSTSSGSRRSGCTSSSSTSTSRRPSCGTPTGSSTASPAR